jgi:superfamily I DNA and/or RNA helicase
VNSAEAEAIASLICAAIEQPEYASNADGKAMSFGVVSMVADQQAMRVDALLRQRLEPAEYKNRRILCGQAAQFQGDERDVMFLSVVDSPPARTPFTDAAGRTQEDFQEAIQRGCQPCARPNVGSPQSQLRDRS